MNILVKLAKRIASPKTAYLRMRSLQVIRPMVLLAIGLVVGGVGAVLLMQSLPAAEGSPEERARKLEVELKRTQNRLLAFESSPSRRLRPGEGFSDRTRLIAENLRDGRPVTPDDVLKLFQPVMRDLAPLFDRMRVRQQQEMIDSMVGELTRKYGLTPAQQEALDGFFQQKAEDEAKRWTELVMRDGTRLEDLMRAAQDVRPDDGLDEFMERTLSGEKLAQFKAERMAERVERVQQEADARVQRLDSIVGLDETQRDQVFGVMARGSKDYDPSMGLEGGAGPIGATPAGKPRDAMLSVLRPDQRSAYEEYRARRQIEAAKDMEALGMTLPADWDFYDEFDLR